MHRDALVGPEAGAQRAQQVQRLAIVGPRATAINHTSAQALGLQCGGEWEGRQLECKSAQLCIGG